MEGNKVYIPDAKDTWLPATVVQVERDGQVVHVIVDGDESHAVRPIDLKEANLTTLPLQNEEDRADGSGVEDMVQLSYLHEASIAYNLKRRFMHNLPYTYTGAIVIAVNPYEWIYELYNETLRRAYASDERAKLPPHVYTTSALAYRNMIDHHVPQSILVSGESGAGKTETVKIMMEHLATLSEKVETQSNIIRKVLKSNPLLETFGNAKTVRNDNSSRFGKFTQLHFDKEHRMIGAKCRHYLLEKSRVVSQAPGERNYHVFYQIVHATNMPTCALYGKQFRYMRVDAEENFSAKMQQDFASTLEALKTIGVEQADQDALFHALAGILHMGEIEFENRGNADESHPVESVELELTSTLIGTTKDRLSTTLCTRTVKARNEMYAVPLNRAQAINNRDALAKELYARLFSWLIHKVNDSLGASMDLTQMISLLDIFGFESFATNSFEQLCINYANEKLQQKFTIDVFKNVQDEYRSECIQWESITYADNQDMLDLIEGKLGLIALLNEECVRPKGSDASYASKVITTHDENPRLDKVRTSQTKFVLHHYAGIVTYTCDTFVEKNQDALQEDVLECCRQSSNPLIASIFAAPPSSQHPAVDQSHKLMKETVSSKFKTQLSLLMQDISATDVHYVRCIKPNSIKQGKAFDTTPVIHQLRCAGVVEAIRITRAAFPNKMPHETFLQRFVILHLRPGQTDAPPTSKTAASACEDLARALIPQADSSIVMGKSRIYFREGVLERLEDARTTQIHHRTLLLQKTARMWLAQREFLLHIKAIKGLQAWIRKSLAQRQYQLQREACIRIQSHWRGLVSRKYKDRMIQRRAATTIQSKVRQRRDEKKYAVMRKGFLRLQATIHTQLTMQRYARTIQEKKEQVMMENQLVALKQRLEDERQAREETEARNTTLQAQLKQMSSSVSEIPVTMEDGKLLDESGKMLEYLREEMHKLREATDILRNENECLKQENKRVKDAYTAAGASFAALNQHNKQQSKANLRLMSTHASLIKSQEAKMKRLQKTIVDQREDLRLQRNVYTTEHMHRIQLQNGLLEILHLAESYDVPTDLLSRLRELTQHEPIVNTESESALAPVPPVSPPFEERATETAKTWTSSGYTDEESRHRRSKIGGMFKKMFKKEPDPV